MLDDTWRITSNRRLRGHDRAFEHLAAGYEDYRP
jgi:hypothetical protein